MKSALQKLLISFSILTTSRVLHADTPIIDSALSDSYHYIDAYEVLIDAAPEDVWPHLVDVRSWMYEFSMLHESGPHLAEGEILRLYEGEDYFLEIVKLVPENLMIGVNLPSRIQGEELSGIGMFTLTDLEDKTHVSVLMARRSAWIEGNSNALGDTRRSIEFQKNTRNRWGRFLNRLRLLAEGPRRNP